jgi:hypothetical protein
LRFERVLARFEKAKEALTQLIELSGFLLSGATFDKMEQFKRIFEQIKRAWTE